METVHLEESVFTRADFAKYPFLKGTASYLKRLNLTLNDITSSSTARILKRGRERVENAILNLTIGKRDDDPVEIPSFAVAVLLAMSTGNQFVKRRYALAEAKQAYLYLQNEPPEKLVRVAQDFEWCISLDKTMVSTPYAILFTDYLRNTTHLRDKKWKLVNRSLKNGIVYLNAHDVARLLQEEIRRRIEEKLQSPEQFKPPDEISQIATEINKIAAEKIGVQKQEMMPQAMVQEAFPPCIKALYASATSGKHLSHIGRFTLTSFLVNIGLSPEQVAELFSNAADYNERLTRYQVEHIAGDRGSGTKYSPPKCETLQTHGLCTGMDNLCRRIYHPMRYYKLKAKSYQKA